ARASGDPPRPTATSKAARARGAGRISCRRPSQRPRRSRGTLRCRPTCPDQACASPTYERTPAMEAVRTVRGRALPLDRADVDTDQIIPAVWLKRIERTGFGEGLFSAWREDPAFVLNRPEHAGALVLVAGPNFGCGSSREHAAWALRDYGFRAVVSSRFADIFRNNALKVGLVPAEVAPEVADALLRAVEADPALEVVVDVEHRRVSAPRAGI